MRIFLFLTPMMLFFSPSHAQPPQGNWESYVMEVNKKPVSVVVDLGLRSAAPMKDRPYVVILRTKILTPETNGQPGPGERERLDAMEDQLVNQLSRYSGAIYVGRFTQRGLREFYFYTLDTVGYLKGVQTAMSGFTEYQFLCQAKEDKAWENYLQVLYPSEKDLEMITQRRQVDLLARKGDALVKMRRIDHYFFFPTKSRREDFLRSISGDKFQLGGMEDASSDTRDLPYALHLFRDDVPSYRNIRQLFMPLWENARKFGGRYDGWETFVIQ
jgi:uncharacterized protein (TIGR01619 family)